MADPRLHDKLDPQPFYKRAILISESLTREECEAWANHPCTRLLRLSLEGDVCGIAGGWIGGMYSNEESVEATAQMQAKARGMAQAIDSILEKIEDISKKDFGDEDDNTDGTQSPYQA